MKKIFSFLLVAIMTMSLSVSAFASPQLSDVPENHWAAEAVEMLVEIGVLTGYTDNTFRGQQTINRYEIAIALQRLLLYLEASINEATANNSAGLSNAEIETLLDTLEKNLASLEASIAEMDPSETSSSDVEFDARLSEIEKKLTALETSGGQSQTAPITLSESDFEALLSALEKNLAPMEPSTVQTNDVLETRLATLEKELAALEALVAQMSANSTNISNGDAEVSLGLEELNVLNKVLNALNERLTVSEEDTDIISLEELSVLNKVINALNERLTISEEDADIISLEELSVLNKLSNALNERLTIYGAETDITGYLPGSFVVGTAAQSAPQTIILVQQGNTDKVDLIILTVDGEINNIESMQGISLDETALQNIEGTEMLVLSSNTNEGGAVYLTSDVLRLTNQAAVAPTKGNLALTPGFITLPSNDNKIMGFSMDLYADYEFAKWFTLAGRFEADMFLLPEAADMTMYLGLDAKFNIFNTDKFLLGIQMNLGDIIHLRHVNLLNFGFGIYAAVDVSSKINIYTDIKIPFMLTNFKDRYHSLLLGTLSNYDFTIGGKYAINQKVDLGIEANIRSTSLTYRDSCQIGISLKLGYKF